MTAEAGAELAATMTPEAIAELKGTPEELASLACTPDKIAELTKRKAGPIRKRKCRECNEPFKPRRQDAHFCSPACRVRWHRRLATARYQQGRGRWERGPKQHLRIVEANWPEYLKA